MVRAVYVPADTEAIGVTRLEVSAPTPGGGWVLTVYGLAGEPRSGTPLTAEEFRSAIREWKWAAEQGRGKVRIG